MKRKHKKQLLYSGNNKPAASMQKAQSVAAPKQEDIDVEKMVRRQQAIERRNERAYRQSQALGFNNNNMRRDNPSGARSIFIDPLMLDANRYGTIRTISPYYGRQISYKILRAVSQKAWILNVCILNVIRKARPFIKVSTSANERGFCIKKRDMGPDDKMTEAEQARAKELSKFLLKTGDAKDPERKDDLNKYTTKILRDLFQLDQISCELQYTRDRKEICAFWAMDTATIEVALPNDEEIGYVQVVYNVPHAYFTGEELIFDCMNPRTDIEKAGYGYSLVEQAIDLITSAINTFMYNAGFFQENKLPRGIMLLQGDADPDVVEEIEDYIVNAMSGPPSNQWRIPIIPSGRGDGGGGDERRRIDFVNLQGNNKEMEFQSWFDLQLSGIVSLFGESMESLGLHSQKSQPLISADTAPKSEATKSQILGDVLGFLQNHFNQILEKKDPDYEFEFVGYEKDDPNLKMQMDKTEVETYKSIDEKRAEMGLEPFNKKWSSVPLNPYVIQLLQSEEGGMFGPGCDEDMEGGEDEGEEDAGGSPDDENADTGEGDTEGGGSGWDEIESRQNGGGDPVGKSLNKRQFMRIVI
jgi:hypothetical protein